MSGAENSDNAGSQFEDDKVINLLFVCSMNKWRSPTAEEIYAKHELINARSRGTSKKAVRRVNADDLKWADIVFVMESKHRQQLQSRFPGETKYTEIHVLDIPDDYQFMDPELIQMIQDFVDLMKAHRGDMVINITSAVVRP